MNQEEFEKIMEDDNIETEFPEGKNNILVGLNIIAKYCPKMRIYADHDIIYSACIDELIDAGITKEDTIKLKKLNWMIEEDSLACFV